MFTKAWPWALAAAVALGAAAGEPGNERKQDVLRNLAVEHGAVESVEYFTDPVLRDGNRSFDNLPPRTVVKVRLHPAEGSNIAVEIWLPDAERWNGRFVGLGNGGAAGRIDPGGFTWLVRGGYAAASTDMGTAPNDRSGVGNREVWKDFGYRATHLMTVVAKQAVAAHYGRPPDYAYFNGGSTGGQQALQEAQRYPGDYDGIVADVPAHCRTPLHAYFLWNWQILRACPFTPEQEAAVVAAGNAHMASREPPPTAGKIVSDPRGTAEDIEAVIALARRRAPSLTDRHAEALRKIFEGPRHAATGEVIFGGIPFGAAFGPATGHLYLFGWAFEGKKKFEDIDFGDDIDAYTAALGPYLNAENPDLAAFAARGGKILIVSGSADSVVPYHATLDYYERVIEAAGSLEAARTFSRFYLVPGRAHGPGPGVNNTPGWLDLVMAWREGGIAPEGVLGRRYENGPLAYQIPIFPYPARAVYDPARRAFRAEEGLRGGVARVAERFRPPARDE